MADRTEAMDNLIAQDADLIDAQTTQNDGNFQNLALNESFERVAKVAQERAAFNEQMTNERLRQSIEQLTKDTAAEWQAGYDAGVEASAMVLEDDAKKCDCFARNEGECGCGAWCEWKSITSARAVEIVLTLKGKTNGG